MSLVMCAHIVKTLDLTVEYAFQLECHESP